jgi:hypothetical protein
VFAEVFMKTESGEEEKEIIGICQHIGPSSQQAMMFCLNNCMKITLKAVVSGNPLA